MPNHQGISQRHCVVKQCPTWPCSHCGSARGAASVRGSGSQPSSPSQCWLQFQKFPSHHCQKLRIILIFWLNSMKTKLVILIFTNFTPLVYVKQTLHIVISSVVLSWFNKIINLSNVSVTKLKQDDACAQIIQWLPGDTCCWKSSLHVSCNVKGIDVLHS